MLCGHDCPSGQGWKRGWPCLVLCLLVVPAEFPVLFFVPPLPLPALLLFFEECSNHCSWPHRGPPGSRDAPAPTQHSGSLSHRVPLQHEACSSSALARAWRVKMPGELRAWRLLPLSDWSHSFLQAKQEEVLVPRVAGQIP